MKSSAIVVHVVRTLVLTVGTFVTGSAHGDVVTFTSRTAFNHGTSEFGGVLMETFDSFRTDTQLSSDPAAPTAFTGFDAYHEGTGGPTGQGWSAQIVDVPPPTDRAFPPDPRSTYLNTLTAADHNPFDGQRSQTHIVPGPCTVAFGFDHGQWGDTGNRSDVEVTTNIGVFTILNPVSQYGFLGFHTTEPGEIIEHVTWVPRDSSLGYDAIGIDDVTFTVALTLSCRQDLDFSEDVGFNDLLIVLASWGPCGDCCPADFDKSGDVGFLELLQLLSAWGPCQ